MKPFFSGVFIIPLFALVGCVTTTPRINQFATFSEAGISYTDAVIGLSEEADKTAIHKNSRFLLMKAAGIQTEEQRISNYTKQTKVLQDLLQQTQAYRQHCRLLKRYFALLKQMATVDTSVVGEATAELVAELHAISSRMPVNQGRSVGAIAPDLTTLAVGHYQKQMLEKELKAHAQMIGNELMYQEQHLEQLATQLVENIEGLNQLNELELVLEPYADWNIPKDWIQRREKVLKSSLMPESVENAKEAARTLREKFTLLAEGKMTADDMDALLGDIHAIFDIVDHLQQQNENEGSR